MSRVVSPLQVQVLAIAADSRRVEVDLYGEDGRLLGRSLLAVPGSTLGDLISVSMPFEIRGTSEIGYIHLSTKNLQGRLQAAVTVPVLLLSSGASEINPAGNTIYERVALANLPPEAEISGGVVAIRGQVLPYNSAQIVTELETEEGRRLSLRVLNATGTDWQTVDTTLPYQVEAPTAARIFVRQADSVIDGDGFLFSQPITLLP
jgi:hypothetical protein